MKMRVGLNDIDLISKEIKKRAPNGGIVLLRGDLASGKTTLVKSFVNYSDVEDEVTSPTFSVMNSYGDKIFHYDIYNEGVEKFVESGLLENLEEEGYHFIEWGDEKLESLLKDLGYKYIVIDIKEMGDEREYEIYES
jgi:tRNA threonylcarbamoyladenosine biosynthesis protein TsaE